MINIEILLRNVSLESYLSDFNINFIDKIMRSTLIFKN
jgi:hypothetical protein